MPGFPRSFFLGTFGVYLRTLCPSFNVNDSAETILACHSLSLQHPPGYPLFTFWGRLVDLLPLGQPMFRVSLASSLLGAFTVILLYRTLQKWNRVPSAFSNLFALFVSLCFAFSYLFWTQSGGAKGGLYVLNALVTVSIFHLLKNSPDCPRPAWTLITGAFFLGLGLANHWESQFVTIPAYLFLAWPIMRSLATWGAKWIPGFGFSSHRSFHLFIPSPSRNVEA